MTKKTLPYTGEFVNPYDYPAPVKMARVTVGPAETNDVVLTTAGAYALFNVPAGTIVLAVMCKIITAFTATLTMTIGDATAADGFLASADVVPGTINTVSNSLGAGQTYAPGKLYTTATDIIATSAVATAAVGLAEVYIIYALAGGD